MYSPVAGTTLSIILSSVLLSSIAQILLKTGMSSRSVSLALENGNRFDISVAIAFNGYVVGGLFVYFVGAVLWLFVLAKLDVSLAYPFIGIGLVFTMFLAHFLIGEPITFAKLAGTLLVGIGIILITR